MTKIKIGHCSNRNVVHADKLYSPRYDFEGDPGLAWYEISDSDAMCFWGICNHRSYNAWVDAADLYINKTLVPHYKKILNRANAIYGGAALPIELVDRFNKVEEIVNDWKNTGYRSTKTWRDDFRNPFGPSWQGEIRQVIDHFDAAACAFDELDDIAVNFLKQPALAKGAPVRQLEHIEGGYLGGGGGGGGPPPPRSNWTRALGTVAIGAAGYFVYKVLTE